MSLLRIVLIVAGLASVAVLPGRAFANDYPNRVIKIIVPYSAGGPGDIISRGYANELSKVLKQTVIVENRPGAGTAIGTQAAKLAPDDGYTLLFGTAGIISTMLSLKNPGYSMDDFVPVVMLGDTYYVLMVSTAVPAASFPEFVDYARKNPERMNYATLGPGASSHVLADRLQRAAKFEWQEISYKGGGPAIQALMSNDVQGYFTTQASAVQLVDSDKVRLMAIAAPERNEFLPNVPTFKERGYDGIVDQGWYTILIRSSTPPELVEKLRRASEQVMTTLEMRVHQKSLGLTKSKVVLTEFPTLVTQELGVRAEDNKRLGIEPQ